ncbi:MAG: hypothetical protein ABL996_10140 [Micropepsaceae bacterium]
MSTIACSEHGERTAAAVCIHIVQTLKDMEPRGFLPQIDDDGGHSAICIVCNEMPFDEWERTKLESFAMICLECYRKAADLNDADIPEVMQ